MKKNLSIAIILASCLLTTSCRKKNPAACFTLEPTSPKVDESVVISGDCSTDAAWFEYTIDGVKKSGDANGTVYYTFSASGKRKISLTVYSKMNGTINTRSGTCTGCSGTGKSNTISQDITVIK